MQFVAPGSSGNVLVSNGSTWTSGGAGVTSAVAGNGIAVSGATGAVTISAIALSFNAVGSYAIGQIPSNVGALSPGSTFAGSALRVYNSSYDACTGLMAGSSTSFPCSGTYAFVGFLFGSNNLLAVRVS